VEQADHAGRARHKDVRAAIVVHIGERGIGTALDNPVGVGEQRKRPVEVVPIGAEGAAAHEEQVEIAVVVEVDEQRVSSAVHVAHAGSVGHIVEPLAFTIVQ